MKKMIALLMAALTLLGCVSTLAESAFTPAAYEWKFIKKIPMKPKYTEEVEHKGTVERLTYATHSYALEAVAAGTEPAARLLRKPLSADGAGKELPHFPKAAAHSRSISRMGKP